MDGKSDIESDTQCKEKGNGNLDPSLKICPWTDEEDRFLFALHSKYGKKWSEIASKMVGRSYRQCREHWNQCLDPTVKKGPWNIVEDRLLGELYTKYGPKWSHISSKMNGRTDKQCRARWHRVLDPKSKKGFWTKEEDELLVRLHSKYGNQWSEIASKMNGRSIMKCRQRWYETLDPTLKKGPWTEEENKLLVELYSKYGAKWTFIASKLDGRSDKQCRRRYYNSMGTSLKKTSSTKAQDTPLFDLHGKNGYNTQILAEQIFLRDFLKEKIRINTIQKLQLMFATHHIAEQTATNVLNNLHNQLLGIGVTPDKEQMKKMYVDEYVAVLRAAASLHKHQDPTSINF